MAVPEISGKTKLVALIGSPVEHSRSPQMHNASFDALGIDARYLVFDVGPDKLACVAQALSDMGLVGYNVTMPCKRPIMDCLDDLSDAARLIGAVNTVALRDDGSYGDNTDGRGFWTNCRECGFDVRGKRVVVLGAGGAGSAVFVQAALEGAACVSVFNRPGRNFTAALDRAAAVREFNACPVEVCDIGDAGLLSEKLDDGDIVVNCTKVGMAPNEDESLIAPELMHPGLWVADTVYNPLETKLLREARARGLSTVPGLGMLLWQGVLAEQVWFPGIDPDVGAIRRALFGR